VDDEASVLRSLKHLLWSEDLEAEMFEDPLKFLDYVRMHRVKLAVLDFWMPAKTGSELQQLLHDVSPETRVIIMTGGEEATIRSLALECGAFAFLSKPFDAETFFKAVHSALSPENGAVAGTDRLGAM